MRGIVLTAVIEGRSVPGVLIPQLVDFHREGRLPIDPLIRFYKFEDINQAAADMTAGRTIKAVLRISDL